MRDSVMTAEQTLYVNMKQTLRRSWKLWKKLAGGVKVLCASKYLFQAWAVPAVLPHFYQLFSCVDYDVLLRNQTKTVKARILQITSTAVIFHISKKKNKTQMDHMEKETGSYSTVKWMWEIQTPKT